MPKSNRPRASRVKTKFQKIDPSRRVKKKRGRKKAEPVFNPQKKLSAMTIILNEIIEDNPGIDPHKAMEIYREEYCAHLYRVVETWYEEGEMFRRLLCECGDTQTIEGSYIPKRFEMEDRPVWA